MQVIVIIYIICKNDHISGTLVYFNKMKFQYFIITPFDYQIDYWENSKKWLFLVIHIQKIWHTLNVIKNFVIISRNLNASLWKKTIKLCKPNFVIHLHEINLIFVVDQRVKDWPLMSSPFYTMGICLTYVFVVKYAGPKLMENRKPFNLKNTLIVYNLFQVVFSVWLFYEVQKLFHTIYN